MSRRKNRALNRSNQGAVSPWSETPYWFNALTEVLEGVVFPATKWDILASMGCEELDLEDGDAVDTCELIGKLPNHKYESVSEVLDEIFSEFKAASGS